MESAAGPGCEFYDGDSSLPVYKWTKRSQHFSVEELAKILIANPVPKEKVCSKQPVRVCRNVAFVVDLHSLDDPLDIRADENGVWKRKGSPVTYVSIHSTSEKTRVFKRSRMRNHPNHYKVIRTYYRHNSSPDFTRIITVVHGKCFKLYLHDSDNVWVLRSLSKVSLSVQHQEHLYFLDRFVISGIPIDF